MDTFVIALAAVVIGVPLSLWVIWRIIKWKLRRMFDGLSGAFDRQPAHIKLVRADREPTSKEWNQHLAALRHIGFQSVGTFMARQRPAVKIHGMVDESRSMYGVVYSHGKQVHADIVTLYPDGRVVTTTSMPLTGLDTPPFHTMHRLPGAAAGELVRDHLAKRPGISSHATEPRFAKDFEATHERLMEWRLLRGVSEEEVRRGAKLDPKQKGKPLDDEAVRSTIAMIRETYDEELKRDLIDRALEQGGYPEDLHDELQDCCLVVTPATEPDDIVDHLVESAPGWSDDHEEQPQKRARLVLALSAGPIRDTFHGYVDSLTGVKPLFLASFERPIAGDVYLLHDPRPANETEEEVEAEA
jgi:hypothetical protein